MVYKRTHVVAITIITVSLIIKNPKVVPKINCEEVDIKTKQKPGTYQ